MRLTITLIIALAASLWGNFAAPDRSARIEPVTPELEMSEAPAPPTAPTAVVDKTTSPDHPRAAELRKIGLDKQQLAAVIEPGFNGKFRQRLDGHAYQTDEALRAELSAARREREDALEEILGRTDDDLNVYDPERIDIHYDFKPPKDGSPELLRRDFSRRADPHELSKDLPDDEARAIHRILFQVGGVALDRPAKEKLVALARENWGAPDKLAAALGANFEPATAAQLQRCFEPGHWRAYQHATLLSDEPAERAAIAARALDAEESQR